MLILYKNDRNVRFVIFTKTSIDRLILGKLWSLCNTQINVFILVFGHLVNDLSIMGVMAQTHCTGPGPGQGQGTEWVQ